MSLVKAETDSHESSAIFRHPSRRGVFFPLSEWRNAFSDLREVVSEALGHEEGGKPFHWLDIGGSTFLETEDIVGVLRLTYMIGDEQEIRSWLELYPGSTRVLLQVPRVVQDYFPDAKLRLEVRTDPEAGDDQRLGIYIRTSMDPEEAVEQFSRLDSEWGDRLHDLTEGDLLLNIESKS